MVGSSELEHAMNPKSRGRLQGKEGFNGCSGRQVVGGWIHLASWT
jgi:hypothetical protein